MQVYQYKILIAPAINSQFDCRHTVSELLLKINQIINQRSRPSAFTLRDFILLRKSETIGTEYQMNRRLKRSYLHQCLAKHFPMSDDLCEHVRIV